MTYLDKIILYFKNYKSQSFSLTIENGRIIFETSINNIKVSGNVKKKVEEIAEVFWQKLSPPLPEYVSLDGVALRYDELNDWYYRDAGLWSIEYYYLDGKLMAVGENMPLIKTDYDTWFNDNEGYV